MTTGQPPSDDSKELGPQVLSELVRRIVECANPLRIVLFGSAARGEVGPDSDLDLLVVIPDGVHRRRTAQSIYRSLAGLGVAKEIVVVTEKDVREHGENPSLVLFRALREGGELYGQDEAVVAWAEKEIGP